MKLAIMFLVWFVYCIVLDHLFIDLSKHVILLYFMKSNNSQFLLIFFQLIKRCPLKRDFFIIGSESTRKTGVSTRDYHVCDACCRVEYKILNSAHNESLLEYLPRAILIHFLRRHLHGNLGSTDRSYQSIDLNSFTNFLTPTFQNSFLNSTIFGPKKRRLASSDGF